MGKYRCIKDVVMDESNDIGFTKGKIYERAEYDSEELILIDNNTNPHTVIEDDDDSEFFKEHFELIKEEEKMENKILVADFSGARVGDKVKTSRGLRGRITQNDKLNEHGIKGIEINPHPILVLFDGDYHDTCLTYSGKYNNSDVYSTVFYDYKDQFPKEEHCKRPLPKIWVDEKVLVWDNEGNECREYFKGYNQLGDIIIFGKGRTSWSCSARDIGVPKYWKTADGKHDSGNLEEIEG